MSQIGERAYTAPLFEKFTFEELSARSGYSLHYLFDMAEGRRALTPRFRKTICIVLQRPEAELFYPEPEE